MKRKKPTTRRMPVIGLTGSIGMGKSTAAAILRTFGLPIYEADKAVHSLLRRGGKAVKPVTRLFPASLQGDGIDRKRLGRMVFDDPAALKKLEKILHPLVRHMEDDFLRRARARKAVAAVLEIPLLFETGGHKRCNYVICVTAPKAVQKSRVMKRRGMTEEKFKAIHTRQWPDRKKRQLADFVIQTGGTRSTTERQLQQAVEFILGQ